MESIPTSAPPIRDIAEEALEIHPAEAEFAHNLHGLLPTPRSAKRFSNTYRLLKATVRADELADFDGIGRAGGFRVPMVLLALVVGRPAEATRLFEILEAAANAGRDPIEALKDVRPVADAPGLPRVVRELQAIAMDDLPRDPGLYRAWIPRVARYSFHLGRASGAEGRTPAPTL